MSLRPCLIAQISDLHIKRPGALVCDKVDTAAALARCVAELNRFRPRPDLVVISGDLADTPAPEEYEHLLTLLEPLEIPFIAIPGNHDRRDMLRKALPRQPYARTSGALNLIQPVGDLDVVAIDSSVPGAAHGELDGDTLGWLDAILATSARHPALLFVHHPPFATGIGHMDAHNLRNADALAAAVGRHPRARLIAAGHIHRATVTQFAGIAATVCPAPNHAIALDLAGELPLSFRVEQPAFHLHVWFPGEDFGRVVTHTVAIGDFEGPHPFFSAR